MEASVLFDFVLDVPTCHTFRQTGAQNSDGPRDTENPQHIGKESYGRPS